MLSAFLANDGLVKGKNFVLPLFIATLATIALSAGIAQIVVIERMIGGYPYGALSKFISKPVTVSFPVQKNSCLSTLICDVSITVSLVTRLAAAKSGIKNLNARQSIRKEFTDGTVNEMNITRPLAFTSGPTQSQTYHSQVVQITVQSDVHSDSEGSLNENKPTRQIPNSSKVRVRYLPSVLRRAGHSFDVPETLPYKEWLLKDLSDS
ncbi:hypothetical protein CVT24_004963 [Panaeolus cyanescens]|uniref:Uncharacterized protein n=1 Tax=Panaeolus cyanescens TaxID=181874 RepID=A0A409YB41_9AGAR|nr:hypothetical protein CVT24_004963 [Panaeolus cyanescens]